ncbi:MAG: CDP-glycerol glycerophosphotransferase family protein [Gemmatimonadota bacterium]|nr:CDP-glycerol glycerophosphotransferase family protein [Gemmatimonadota bacterium]
MDSSAQTQPKQILFAGYAPVHFLCFLPVYQRLSADPRVEVWLTGGYRRKDQDDAGYVIDGFYDRFRVRPDRVIPFDQAYDGDFDVAICAHTSDTLLPRSARRKVQIFHGVSFKNFAVREKVLRFDLLCLPGRYHAERFRDCGLVRPGGSRCLLTGFAKADRLVEPGFQRERFLQNLGVDPALPTILYAPTGGKHNSLETVGRDVVAGIHSKVGWNLLIKPHDHPKNEIDWYAELGGFESERVRLVRDLDVVDYLRAVDLLLTDASSVAVEYTLMDRPIVFIEVAKLLKNVLKRGAPLDLLTYGRKIGLLAKTADQVVPAIEQALRNPDREQELRRSMARHVFHDPGNAADRVSRVVLHAAGLLEELPADVEVLRP